MNTTKHQYWSQTACKYDAATAYVIGETTQRRTKNWLQAQITVTDQVLDLGCGTGLFSEIIASQAQSLIATDLSNEMLQLAAARLAAFDNTTVQKADSYTLPFPQNTFDAVVLGNLLHIIKHPARVIQEAYRVLKAGGCLLTIDATTYGLTSLGKICMAVRYLRGFGFPPRDNKSLDPMDVIDMAKGTGFTITSLKLIGYETKSICMRGQK